VAGWKVTRPVLTDWMRVLPVAASSHSAPDRAPGEIALLGVCCAALIAAAAVVIRRSRVLRRGPGRPAQHFAPRVGEAEVESAGVVSGPDHAEPDLVAESPDADTAAAGAHRLQGGGSPPRVAARAWAAAAIVLAVGIATAVLMVHGKGASDNGAAGSRNVVAAINPAAAQEPTTGTPAASNPASSTAASPPSSRSARSSGAPSHAPTSPATTAPSTPAPAQPAAGTLSGPTSVEMTAIEEGVTYTAAITVTAENGEVKFSVSEPASEDPDYSMSFTSGSGTLQSGDEQTVRVTVTVLDEVSDPYVTMSPGGAAVTLLFPPVRVITTCPTDSQLKSLTEANAADFAIPCP
jgi:hypothetical protein